MPIDPSRFHPVNVSDTCAVWNVLSSRLLYRRARDGKCEFTCSWYVHYEALYRRRSSMSRADIELRERLKVAQANGSFAPISISLGDLQVVANLESRRQLSLGELSSIALAVGIGHAFLTDDQAARRLAQDVLTTARVQTTPHLLAWLYFVSLISDTDVDAISEEHERLGRPLRPHFRRAHEMAMMARAMERTRSPPE